MKLSLLFFVSLVAATPVAQFVSFSRAPNILFLTSQLQGGGKSFACQHDHLHLNPECKSGATGAGAGSAGGGLAALLKGAGGAGAGSSAGGLADLLGKAGGASGGASAETPAAAPATDADAEKPKAEKPKAAAGGHAHGAR